MKSLAMPLQQASTLLSTVTGRAVSVDQLKKLLPARDLSALVTPKELRQAHARMVPSRKEHLLVEVKASDKRPPIVCCHFKKGGVGKTTILSNIAIELARQGLRVCYIDADPQGTSTTLFGIDIEDESLITLQGLIFADKSKPISPKEAAISLYSDATLDLIPADNALAGFDRAGHPLNSREWLFEKLVVKNMDFFSQYDIVLIDTNPATNLLNLNLMATADYILTPVSLDVPTMKSMKLMIAQFDELEDLQAGYKQHLIVANNYHSAFRHSKIVLQDLQAGYPDEIFDTVVPNYVGVARQGWTNDKGTTLIEREPKSSAALSLSTLAIEFANRIIWKTPKKNDSTQVEAKLSMTSSME